MNLPDLNNKVYWEVLSKWASNNSDGCSKVPDIYVEACWEHDFHFRYGKTMYGDLITFGEANSRFRKAMQMRSKARWLSPISWIRFLGVKLFGKGIWKMHRERNLPLPQEILNELKLP